MKPPPGETVRRADDAEEGVADEPEVPVVELVTQESP